LGRPEDAARAYKKYLEGSPKAIDRATVEARIANLEKRGQAPPPTPGERVVFKTIVVYRDAPPQPGRVARWAAWGVGVLAAAGLASGIATAVLAAQAADDEKKYANPMSP